jgi:hypothetical protein
MAKRKKPDIETKSLEAFELLDAAGANAQSPESAVSMVWRHADGHLEISPYEWSVPFICGRAIGPWKPAQRCIRAV